MFIDKKFIENGKRIAVLDGHGGDLIEDCIHDAIHIAKTGKYDEVRFNLNGVNLVANENSNYIELHNEFVEEINNMYPV